MHERHKDRSLYFKEQGITTEKYVIPYIEEVVPLPENAEINKMNSKKLALCVAPQIQWGLQMMIDHYDDIFVDIP